MSKKLYNLIKSLTPNEKGYFRKFSSMHVVGNENLYMKLFDALNEMDGYDKSQLPKLFRKKRMENQLPAYTNYLFTNILDALKIYHARKTLEAEIRHMLLDVELLFAKRLYPEARKILTKARGKATRSENLFLLVEIINWEEKIAKNDPDSQLLEKIIHSNHEERLKITDQLKVSLQYKWLHSRVIYLIHKIGQHIKGNDELSKLEEIMLHPLLRDEKSAKTLHDKNTFYYIHALYHYIKREQDIRKSIEYTHKRKKLMEENIQYASLDMNAYLSTFNNLMSSYMQILEVSEYDKLVEDLKKMPERFGNNISEKHENMRNAYINSATLVRYFLTGEFEKGLSAVRGNEKTWENVQAKIGRLEVLVFYDNMRSLSFAAEDLKRALFWNNRILNESEAEFRSDLYSIAMIWNIIIHYDMENFQLVESLIRSVIHAFDADNRSHQFEKLFFKSMKKIIDAKDEEQVRKGFSAFKKDLILLKRHTGEIMELDCISYLAWLDSHIEDRKYSEVIKKYLPVRP
ncbi:MAG: hypothetical protein HYU69_09710 [Bacteroidetes bacterium]|nr:hypothetical protein [Bacteroidota bacterium]